MIYSKFDPTKEKKAVDYSKWWLLTQEDFKFNGNLLQKVVIPANTKQRRHFHKIQTEVFYITKGLCTITVNGQDFEVAEGDSMICEPNDIHNLWNKSDKDFELVVFKINYPKENPESDSYWID